MKIIKFLFECDPEFFSLWESVTPQALNNKAQVINKYLNSSLNVNIILRNTKIYCYLKIMMQFIKRNY